jgi:hypothetical protein
VAQGLVPGHGHRHRLARQDTEHESSARAAVLEIQNVVRLLQATKTHALNPDLGFISDKRRDLYAQIAKRLCRRLRILPQKKTAQAALSRSE